MPTTSKLDPAHDLIALDAVADMVRAFGEGAFDTHAHTGQGIRQRAEEWARHLLLGAPHPLQQRPTARDFVGARLFVRELRKHEATFVRTALSDFRAMISTVFSNFERALVQDGQNDEQMKAQLARLHAAAQGASLEQLRREVTAASAELSSLLGKRERRREEELASLGAELRQLNTRLQETRRTAETDALTAVHNRRAFDAFLERVVELDGVTGTPVSLLMIDVDNFKLLNDTYGHPVGDEALRRIGAALARTFVRKCDFVSRYGGEEFAVIVRDVNPEEARRAGERARAAIAALELQDQPEIELTASIGIATLHTAEDKCSWLKRADDALLTAKQAGKNCCVLARS